MPELLLGPLLRYVDEEQATVWVETDSACEVEVLGRKQRTIHISGHHYALVPIEDLEPGTENPYEVRLDGEVRWPEPGSELPPSVIRTIAPDEQLRIAWGSCRVTVPHEPPYDGAKTDDDRGRGSDALRCYAVRMLEQDPERVAAAPVHDRRPGLRRRGLAQDAGFHPGTAQHGGSPVGAGRRLRGVHAPLPRGVVRADGPLAPGQRRDGDALRRPRRPRRLEHLDRVARGDALAAVVARPHHRRAGRLLGLPAPREPLAEDPRRDGPAARGSAP